MSTRKAEIRKCDICGKESSDNGETHIGGSPWEGWIYFKITTGSTNIEVMRMQSEFDFCGVKCLKKYLKSEGV